MVLAHTPENRADGWDRLAWLYREYHGRLVALCWHYLRDWDLAEDVAHEVMLKARRSMPDDVNNPWHWICRVAKNACIDEIRKTRMVVPVQTIENFQGTEDPERHTISKDELAGLHSALATLPAKHQETLRLAYWERMTYEEIGRSMGIPATSVRDRLHYSREILRKKLRHLNETMMLWGPIYHLRRWLSDLQAHGLEVSLAAVMAIPIAVVSVVEGTPIDIHGTPQVNSSAQDWVAVRPVGRHETHPATAGQAFPAAEVRFLSDPVTLSNGVEEDDPGSAGIEIGPIVIRCLGPDDRFPIAICSLLPPI